MAGRSSIRNQKPENQKPERDSGQDLVLASGFWFLASDDRAAIIAEARSWLGTPYHHQASVKQVGCDCLGLLRGVWRAVIGPEPEAMVAYTPDWGQATGEETLLVVANRHLVPIALAEARHGDVLVFRMKPRAVAKHCGILTGSQKPETGNQRHLLASCLPTSDFRFIHAHQKAGTVEANLSDWWRRRIAGAFSFPESTAHPYHPHPASPNDADASKAPQPSPVKGEEGI